MPASFLPSPVHRVSDLLPDTDPEETAEWVDSINQVIEISGRSRARFLLLKQLEISADQGVPLPPSVSTPYLNTISPDVSPPFRARRRSSGAYGRSCDGTRPRW